MKRISIRATKEADVEEIVILCALHAEYEQSDYDPKGKKEELKKHLFSDSPSLYGLLALINDEIVGYATYMKQFSTWDAAHYIYMDCLFLREEARGFGIGQMLVERIQEEGKKLGCQLIQWQTPDFNTRAMKFYERIGADGKSKERYFLAIQ
ncbi:MAG: GNAT family N-acetyltransferase [Bacteroidota bacterium]